MSLRGSRGRDGIRPKSPRSLALFFDTTFWLRKRVTRTAKRWHGSSDAPRRSSLALQGPHSARTSGSDSCLHCSLKLQAKYWRRDMMPPLPSPAPHPIERHAAASIKAASPGRHYLVNTRLAHASTAAAATAGACRLFICPPSTRGCTRRRGPCYQVAPDMV